MVAQDLTNALLTSVILCAWIGLLKVVAAAHLMCSCSSMFLLTHCCRVWHTDMCCIMLYCFGADALKLSSSCICSEASIDEMRATATQLWKVSSFNHEQS